MKINVALYIGSFQKERKKKKENGNAWHTAKSL